MKRKYSGINGLKAWGCLGIIAMHILANANYQYIKGWPREMIRTWTELVYLFLIVSAFGLCCGYYDKFKSKSIDIGDFYRRRYRKIQPFFVLLIIIAIVLDSSKENIIEGFIESTLLFGFLPNNNLDLLGVSWTLGVIFVFYFFFPFYCELISNKKQSLFFLVVSLIISYSCSEYFFSSSFVINNFPARHNFLYCLPFFLCGGVFYLYRERIENLIQNYSKLFLILLLLTTALYYLIPDNIFNIDIFLIKQIVVMSFWVIYAIGGNRVVFNNRIINYLSKNSMEMYLAQMIIFRLIEKLGLLYIFGHGYSSFALVFIIEIIGLLVFIRCCKFVIEKITSSRVFIKFDFKQ